MSNNNIQTKIADILRTTGSASGLAKAKVLEAAPSPMTSLHLRSLNLSATTVADIARLLRQEREAGHSSIRSISFSYNSHLGDSGAIALAASLPHSISEVGLVGCSIGDAGGSALLEWVKTSPRLSMICIEENNFSGALKNEFRKLSAANPRLLVVT